VKTKRDLARKRSVFRVRISRYSELVWYVKFHEGGTFANLSIIVSYVYVIIDKDTGQIDCL